MRSQNSWKRLLALSCLSVYLSAVEQLGSHWTDGFSWRLIFEGCSKIRRERSSLWLWLNGLLDLHEFITGLTRSLAGLTLGKIVSVTVMLYLRMQINLCPYGGPHFLADLGEIWSRMSVSSCELRENRCRGGQTLLKDVHECLLAFFFFFFTFSFRFG